MKRALGIAGHVLYVAAFVAIIALAAIRMGLWTLPTPAPAYAAGREATFVTGVDFSATPKTVLLFVRSDCRFCSASMDFYRRIAESDAVRDGQVRLVVAGPESPDVIAAYLDRNRVKAQQVATTSGDEIKATPTLVLVGRNGVIEAAWVGKQPPEREDVILARMRS